MSEDTKPVEIPLRRKYLSVEHGRYKGGHNNNRKKHPEGWSKHKYGNGINHIPYVVGRDTNGKKFKRCDERRLLARD